MFDLNVVRLVILDIDGVIYSSNLAIPGASDSIHRLRRSGIVVKFLTNDAFNSRSSRANELNALGFDVLPSDIYTPAFLATNILKSLGNPSTMLLGGGEIIDEFIDTPLVDSDPEVVIVGDNFHSYEFDKLNQAFLSIFNGARFMALQSNQYCPSDSGPVIDAGFWVAGLEYCTGKKAEIIGKPSLESYLTVCREAQILPDQAVMVSDDAFSDLVGAKKAGLRTIHVSEYAVKSNFTPSLAPDLELSDLLQFVKLICKQ